MLCSLTASRAQAIQARATLTEGLTALQHECSRWGGGGTALLPAVYGTALVTPLC